MTTKGWSVQLLVEYGGAVTALALAVFVGVRVGVIDGVAVALVGAGMVGTWHVLVTAPPPPRRAEMAPMRREPQFWSRAFRVTRTGMSAGVLLLLSGAVSIGALFAASGELKALRFGLLVAAALLVVVGVGLLATGRLRKP